MSGKQQISAKDFKRLAKVGPGGSLTLSEDLPEVSVEANKKGFMFNPEDYIFIPGRVYSSKNSTQIRTKIVKHPTKWMCRIKNKDTGVELWKYVKPFISKNDNALGYMSKKAQIYEANTERFKSMYKGIGFPIFVEMIFVMPDKSGWDWNNISQLVCDCMTAAKWVPDDSVHYMFALMPMSPKLSYYINKKSPGVYIKVIK